MGFFDKNILQAKKHNEEMKRVLSKATDRTIRHTRIYDFQNFINVVKTDDKASLTFIELSTTDAIRKLRKQFPNKKVAVLNFADYKNPGGGYLLGAMAQEESLCHRSNLFQIESYFNESFYKDNRLHLNSELYLNRALYSPDVIFDKKYAVDVITCAAPNFRLAYQKHEISYASACLVLKNRMKFVKKIAENEQVDILILGAWGAGFFGFHVNEVALLWKEIFLETTSIKKVIFAVVSKHHNNAADAFKEYF